MLLEVRATDNGPRWHASFARFTNLPVSARYKNAKVYSFEQSAEEESMGGPNQRFYVAHGVEVLPASGPE